jgi:hypothetical protein
MRNSSKTRVVVVRHADLTIDSALLTRSAVRGFLDQAATTLTGESRPADAWACWFNPRDRVAIKVNCLGLPTHHVVGEAVADAIGAAGVVPANTIVWDRTDRELERAGYRLSRDGRESRCFGTDSLGGRRGGYDETAVLKDHNLAGLSCTLKNFYGAIHNPNKYHDNGCDPFVADVCAHQHIKGRLRLAACDATRPQYHGGPPGRPMWQWPYGGLILSADAVALDRVALEILELKRALVGKPPLAAESRPARYLESAAARGLGTYDLSEIEVLSIGRPWQDVA